MKDQDEFIQGMGVLALVLLALCVLPSMLISIHYWKNPQRFQPKVYLLQFLSGILLLWIAYYLKLGPIFVHKILMLWIFGLLVTLLLLPLILLLRKQEAKVRLHHFKNRVSWQGLAKAQSDSTKVVVGKSLSGGGYVQLENAKRTAHVLIIGATGTGKTTLMKNLIFHAIRHNQPCVVIDPKGDDNTVEQVTQFWESSGSVNPFKVFSMSRPDTSAHYNPLKYGNANQLKDRMMEAFNWSEQYYESIAGSFLTALTSATFHIGISLNLDYVSKLMSFKEEQSKLLNALKDKHNVGDPHALILYERVSAFFSKSKDSELMGLAAQVSILNNPTFGPLLSFSGEKNELDLRELRRNRGVAYFQLDTLGNADSARRLGRMIIEDIKSLSSEVYKTESGNRVFYPIFIDEFGSFAAKEFVEMLKQSRGANFALHLFCQGLEDLDVVSPEFRRQILSNSLTKIALRVDDNSTVDEFCSAVGTVDTIEQSFQVEGTFLKRRTGMGNERVTKQMVVEHDVLKNLRTGQAVVVDKSTGRAFGVQIPQVFS